LNYKILDEEMNDEQMFTASDFERMDCPPRDWGNAAEIANQKIQPLLRKLEIAVEALKDLCDAVDATNEASVGIFQIASIHGCKYSGPTHQLELKAAKEALAEMGKAK
jgi:hypothetical protein